MISGREVFNAGAEPKGNAERETTGQQKSCYAWGNPTQS